MKARPFLAVVLAILVTLLSLAGAGWWWVLAHSPLQLQHRALAMPLAARFVPRQAPLSLYVFSDGDQLEAYARAVAPGRRRRQAAEAVARLRDSAFALAGLDYRNELASWLAPETGLALFAERPGAPPRGWVLSLRSRDADGARRFLQRFWQTRSLAGTDLQVSSYRGMGLISGRGAVLGQPAVPLATALINDELVLIASGRGVLEQALDVSQIDELNQASSPALQAGLDELGEGLALISARPQLLQAWFPEAEGIGELLAALRPEGSSLLLDARLALSEPLEPVPGARDTGLVQALRGEVDSLALLQAPALWPEALQAVLTAALATQASPMPSLVAAADEGPLLWAQGPRGWLLGTTAQSPAPEQLQPQLQLRGLVEAQLDLEGQPVQVWTRLQKRAGSGEAQLEATLVGAHTVPQAGAPLWWAESLAALAQQLEQRQVPRQRLAELEALEAPGALLRWTLAQAPARALLLRWQPWQLLSGLAGQPLSEAVDGLSVALAPQGDQLQLKVRLRLH